MSPVRFIRAMHPKTNVLPYPDSLSRLLRLGWVAQLKIHGHRAQIHIPASEDQDIVVLNRQGKRHRAELTASMISELRRLFAPKKDWNVIDAEWLKPQKKIFVFDFLKKDGKLLRHFTYPERYALLPKHYISPHVYTLPLLRDLQSCLKALSSSNETVEGLVFKSSGRTGFSDTSIVRCRRRR